MTFREFLVSKKLSSRSIAEAEHAVTFLRSGKKIRAKSMSRYEALRWARDIWAEFSGQYLDVPDGGQTGRLKPAVSMDDRAWQKLYSELEPDGTPAAAVLRVMMSTGLRIGDVLRIPGAAVLAALERHDGLLEAKVKGGKIIKSSVAGASRPDWERLAAFGDQTVAWSVAPYGDGSPDAGRGAYKACARLLVSHAPREKISRFHLHRLRRTVIVQALRSGQDVVRVAAGVGHSNIKTTSSYADETHPEMAANMQDAVAKFRRKV